ncbi:MAG: AraC family transcriptional regulator [Saprospiraceae bacterium]|nr:MAG: AraC family transcriptional regulator [Saprospiraceae bacterium]
MVDLDANWKILLNPPWRLDLAGERATNFLRTVETRFKENRQPRFFARQLHLRLSTLDRACHQTLCCTPSHCICLRVLLEAIRMLENTNLQVQEIADELGYADHDYFIRFFRNKTSWTPAKLRAIIVR